MQGPNCKMRGPKWKMQNKSPPSRAANFFTPFLFFLIMALGGRCGGLHTGAMAMVAPHYIRPNRNSKSTYMSAMELEI
ncbi:hypothetical protein Hanom_Chr12g01177881 [Helianthus anomalus]